MYIHTYTHTHTLSDTAKWHRTPTPHIDGNGHGFVVQGLRAVGPHVGAVPPVNPIGAQATHASK